MAAPNRAGPHRFATPNSIHAAVGTTIHLWMEAGDPSGPAEDLEFRLLGVKPAVSPDTAAGQPLQPEPDS